MIHTGDCVEVMATLPAASVDAIITDPPYDLLSASRNGSRRINNPDNPAGRTGRGFMGKTWDGTGVAFDVGTWAAALRVAKPGAYLLAFGGTRTYHRLACAIEDAGWIIRDCLVWAYAQGFPKSRANLKPAWEPIVMARKPGPLRELAIDECRIGFASDADREDNAAKVSKNPTGKAGLYGVPGVATHTPAGRWPANVILTDPIFDGDVDGVVGGGVSDGGQAGGRNDEPSSTNVYGWAKSGGIYKSGVHFGDTGTYSRFFLIPKAARSDREPNDYGRLVGGLEEGFAPTMGNGIGGREHDPANVAAYRRNVHPTVKPLELMRHLVRLVTPPAGTVLDPFLGSGTTAIAAEMEGFAWIGVEKEAEYVAIAEARLAGVQRGMGLTA